MYYLMLYLVLILPPHVAIWLALSLDHVARANMTTHTTQRYRKSPASGLASKFGHERELCLFFKYNSSTITLYLYLSYHINRVKTGMGTRGFTLLMMQARRCRHGGSYCPSSCPRSDGGAGAGGGRDKGELFSFDPAAHFASPARGAPSGRQQHQPERGTISDGPKIEKKKKGNHFSDAPARQQ